MFFLVLLYFCCYFKNGRLAQNTLPELITRSGAFYPLHLGEGRQLSEQGEDILGWATYGRLRAIHCYGPLQQYRVIRQQLQPLLA